MKILSWDIGIHNLAYCLINFKEKNKDNTENCDKFENEIQKEDNEEKEIKNDKWEIIEWKVIDIYEELRPQNYTCCGMTKKNIICGKSAKYYNSNREYFCKLHAKSDTKELDKCIYDKCKRKKEYSNDHCKIHKEEDENKIIDINKISFYEKSKYIEKSLLCFLDIIHELDYVVIENQPVNKNPVMKSIQMILYTFFLIHGKNTLKEIILKNAGDKLKIYQGPKIECNIKDIHNKNKFLGLKHTEYILNEYNETENINYFNSHKKKDDLADSFLQSLSFAKQIKLI